jgi:Na+:H+ antiporter, NhaA family
MKVLQYLRSFFISDKAGGVILLLATVISLIVANTTLKDGYMAVWNTEFSGHSIVHWINDGLMCIFFLLIGLELERELYTGELSTIKKASLPIFAAIGGMVIPFAIYTIFNFGTVSQSGAGIPMATDIAFAIGILSLTGKRIPASLRIFLTALAVIDDLGAIIIIAIFYSHSLMISNLIISLSIFLVLIVLNRLKVRNLIPYIAGGIAMWYFMLHSGVHATIAGVLLAFAVPFGDGGKHSPSLYLQHMLEKPVMFFILPLFALANTSIPLNLNSLNSLTELFSVGIMAGLFFGKPAGIVLFSLIAVKSGISTLPESAQWKHILGAGLLGGIGFTMSIFITLLAFEDLNMINGAKLAVLIGSTLAGIAGFTWLRLTGRTNSATQS